MNCEYRKTNFDSKQIGITQWIVVNRIYFLQQESNYLLLSGTVTEFHIMQFENKVVVDKKKYAISFHRDAKYFLYHII